MTRDMDDLHFLLCVALIVRLNRNVQHIHQKLAKLMKRTPRSRRGSLAFFIKSKDPAAMLERVLNDWEVIREDRSNAVPEPDVEAGQRERDHDGSRGADDRAEVSGPVDSAGKRRVPKTRNGNCPRDPKTGRFLKRSGTPAKDAPA